MTKNKNAFSLDKFLKLKLQFLLPLQGEPLTIIEKKEMKLMFNSSLAMQKLNPFVNIGIPASFDTIKLFHKDPKAASVKVRLQFSIIPTSRKRKDLIYRNDFEIYAYCRFTNITKNT